MPPDSPTTSTAPRQTIGIVCALHLEVAPLLEQLNPTRTQSGNGLKYYDCALGELRIVVVEGGMGKQRASEATHALIDAFAPSWILSIGLSGALVPEIKKRHIVVGNALVSQSGQGEIRLRINMESHPQDGLHVGKLCMASHIVRTREEKQELHHRTQAIAVDMESLAVAQICKERDTGFMAIRAISDDLSADLPPEVLAIFGPKGTIRAGALLGTLFKRPSSVKDLWKIREEAVAASQQLAKFAITALPQLANRPDQEE